MRYPRCETRRAAAWLAVALLAGGGCGGGDGLPREAVSGKVTFGGKPLDRGAIQFLPRQAGQEGGAWAPVVDGAYSIAAADGPIAGEYAVSITSAPGEGEASGALPGDDSAEVGADVVPEDYNVRTTLKANVEPGKPNAFDFELTRRPAPRKGRRS
ncbi:hypothetical protein [Paludisphaera soli]|uniref:hypothetical protein n=1 Tax=Paludisphaera soli TaxID=2712865 RepID=UPI0013EA0305|nr:hypothetical protein [Paludisphaera soli]